MSEQSPVDSTVPDSQNSSAPSTPVTAAITIANAPFNDPDADVVLCTADNVHFRVYKVLLSLASPVFKDMFKLPQPPSSDPGSTDEGGRPIIPVTENRGTVEMMLRFCYPSVDSMPLDSVVTLEDVHSMLVVTIKYDMQDTLTLVRKRLASTAFVKEEPLRVFAIAYRHGLKEEAILAMKESIRHPIMIPDYPEELKHIPAWGYNQYLQYRLQCYMSVTGVVGVKSRVWSKFSWLGYDQCGCSTLSIGIYNWKLWFYDCVRSITSSLNLRPCPEVLKESIWLSAFEKACGYCSRRARRDVSDFVAGRLIPEVQRAISETPLDFDL